MQTKEYFVGRHFRIRCVMFLFLRCYAQTELLPDLAHYLKRQWIESTISRPSSNCL